MYIIAYNFQQKYVDKFPAGILQNHWHTHHFWPVGGNVVDWSVFQFMLIKKLVTNFKIDEFLIGCVASWMISFSIMVSQYYFQPDFKFWHILAYLHIIAMLNCFCCLWYLNCTAFGYASRCLSQKLEETLQMPRQSVQLTKYRHL